MLHLIPAHLILHYYHLRCNDSIILACADSSKCAEADTNANADSSKYTDADSLIT